MRRAAVAVVVVAATVFLVSAAKAYQDVSQARVELTTGARQLEGLAADPDALRTREGRDALIRDLADARRHIARGRAGVRRSVALRIATLIPPLSTQRHGLLRLVNDAQRVTNVASGLVESIRVFADAPHMTDSTVPIDVLDRIGRDAHRMHRALAESAGASGGLWPPLRDARRQFDETAARLSVRTERAAETLAAARSFLGADRRRQYLLAAENNAEMRARGAVLSFAVLTLDKGRLSVGPGMSAAESALDHDVAVDLPPGTAQAFGDLHPTRHWANANATADFALASRILLGLYRERFGGDTLDGVVALDVPALARLLGAIGAVDVPGLGVLGPDNAVPLLLKEQYDGVPFPADSRARHERLGDATAAIAGRLAGDIDAFAVGSALADAARGAHIRIFSADRAEEEAFERAGVAGGPALEMADRTIEVATQNGTATKLDYYLDQDVAVDVTITPGNTAVVRTTVRLTNRAPAGPPSYQLGPDRPGVRPGEYVGRVDFWGPAGADQLDAIPESGLTLTRAITRIAPGATAAVGFTTIVRHAVRHGRFALRVVPQPRAAPGKIKITVTAPGRRIRGVQSFDGPFDRVVQPSWQIGAL